MIQREIRTDALRGLVLLAAVLFLALSGFAEPGLAAEWPEDCQIRADAGIVMDADTGTVLYGRNIHDTYAPASITKVLTALLVLEHARPEETVTFSYGAVHNVEANSSTAGYDTGDTETVENLLYALLLKSANESANALAEHVAGSTEAFAGMMNDRAAELGCVDSHFANPSGLNNPNHYVSAYDMALIMREALKREEFVRIISTTYYELPPNSHYPAGQGISPGNKMIKSNWKEQYRPDVIGGKTGYTSIALNTLVNSARRDGMTVVTVVLHSDNTQYEDTARMMDFAFSRFRSAEVSREETGISELGGDLTISGFRPGIGVHPEIDEGSRVILPVDAAFSDLTSEISYEMGEDAPPGAAARISYLFGDRPVGDAYICLTAYAPEAAPNAGMEDSVRRMLGMDEEPGDEEEPMETAPRSMPSTARPEDDNAPAAVMLRSAPVRYAVYASAALAVLLVIAQLIHWRTEREQASFLERQLRRSERLKEKGVSEEEFRNMVEEKRNTSADGKNS